MKLISQNEGRPGYKETKIGWIPEEWKVLNLSQISNINSETLTENTDENYSFYYLDLSLVENGNINFPDTKITFSEAPSRARRVLKENDVILSTVRPYLKGFAIANFEVKNVICSTGFALITVRNNSMPYFVFSVLFSEIFSKQYYALTVGSNYPALNNSDVERLKLPIPPLPEQKEIAAILSTWDKAIEKIDALIKAKELQKKGLMQRLLTGKVRLKEFQSKDGKMQMTKFGEIPEDWNHVSINQISSQVNVKNSDNNCYTVLSCTKHSGLVDSLKYFGRQIYSKNLSTYKVVKRNQFAYATNHIEEGSIGYQNLHDFSLISPMYTVFETNGNVNDRFLFTLLKTELYRHIFEINTSATVNRRGSLRWHQFSKIKIPLPTIKEQQKIASVLSECDKEIELLKKEKSTLEQQKKGLMQRLLTGSVRVKTNE